MAQALGVPTGYIEGLIAIEYAFTLMRLDPLRTYGGHL